MTLKIARLLVADIGTGRKDFAIKVTKPRGLIMHNWLLTTFRPGVDSSELNWVVSHIPDYPYQSSMTAPCAWHDRPIWFHPFAACSRDLAGWFSPAGCARGNKAEKSVVGKSHGVNFNSPLKEKMRIFASVPPKALSWTRDVVTTNLIAHTLLLVLWIPTSS